MLLPDLIRTEREKRGWSKSKLAREAHVTPPTIGRLERGERVGRADTIARVTATLGIDPAMAQDYLRDEQVERDIFSFDFTDIPIRRRKMVQSMIEALVREAVRGEGESAED